MVIPPAAARRSPASRARVPSPAVASFVRDIKKNKKFKQLVVYAISGLDKSVKPPRIGWEVRFRARARGGAPRGTARD